MARFKLYTIRFITLVVALQLLNMSLYVQDFKQLYSSSPTAATTEINVTESVSEFVVEVILGHKNAVPEISKQHNSDLQFHKHLSFKVLNEMAQYAMPELLFAAAARAVPLNETYSYLYLQEINPPPPKG